MIGMTYLAGCQTTGSENTLIGGGLGAVIGAGAATLLGGSDRKNALIGAGVGLLAGAAVGNYLDNQEADLKKKLAGTGATVQNDGSKLLVTLPANVTFATDSATIQPQFHAALTKFSGTLNQYPQSYINVIGHTDSTGSESYNQKLSETRAQSVGQFLINNQVMNARIKTTGMGKAMPIAENATPAGRQANRRVEVEILPAVQGS